MWVKNIDRDVMLCLYKVVDTGLFGAYIFIEILSRF
jgi:hypothetical protein